MTQNKLVLTLDSTQIATYLECPRLWNFSHRKLLTPQVREPGEALMMGSYCHKLLEIYYKSRSEGMRGPAAIAKVKEWNPDEESCKCGHSGNCHILLGPTAQVCKDKCPCIKFDPAPYPLSKGIRDQVIQRFTEYCYTYAQDDFAVQDPNQVEVGFSWKLNETVDRLYILEGRIDIFNATFGNAIAGFVDHKTQGRKTELYNKSVQFRNYALVTGATLGIINYIRFSQKISSDTFQRVPVSFSAMEHRWWKSELIKIYDEIATSIRDEVFRPNWASCQGRYNHQCDFTPLCEEFNDSVRSAKQSTLYTIREPWRPW